LRCCSFSRLVSTAPFSGRRSLLLSETGQVRRKLKRRLAIRQTPALGEFRYLRVAYLKQVGGRLTLELEHQRSKQQPAMYVAGTPADLRTALSACDPGDEVTIVIARSGKEIPLKCQPGPR